MPWGFSRQRNWTSPSGETGLKWACKMNLDLDKDLKEFQTQRTCYETILHNKWYAARLEMPTVVEILSDRVCTFVNLFSSDFFHYEYIYYLCISKNVTNLQTNKPNLFPLT